MNDPHVKTLHYLVICGEGVDFDNAPPLQEETKEFKVLINNKKTIFEMKEHFPSIEEARKKVEPYVKAWEVSAGLNHSPGDFRLEFETAEIIDRSPSPTLDNVKSCSAHCGISFLTSNHVKLGISINKFPEPPKDFVASPTVTVMYERYRLYTEGRESLPVMAYWCLTVLEFYVVPQKKKRQRAADLYSIDYEILDNIGRLTEKRGTPEEARKFPGISNIDPLNPNEKQWLIEAVKTLIRRAGERDANPTGILEKIKMSELPPLLGP